MDKELGMICKLKIILFIYLRIEVTHDIHFGDMNIARSWGRKTVGTIWCAKNNGELKIQPI